MLAWVAQVVFLALTVAVVLWLYGNYRTNTDRSNIPTDFEFLDQPADFTIPGSDFQQTEPVRNALVVGLLNTIRVAAAGLVLATVLGVVVGIARLSGNFVVRRLAAFYVETLRNIPLLLVILFCNLGLVLEVLPHINDAWEPLGISVFSNRGIAVPWFVGSGVGLVLIALVAVAAGWTVARWRRAVFDRTGALPRTGLWALGAVVLVLVVGWLGFGYSFTTPTRNERSTSGGIRMDPSYFALLVGLVLYTASHIAEIVRGSIQSVPKGQDEAAQAVGLSGFDRMWYVVLPQAMRVAMPPIGNQYLNLIKNSSLAAGIGYFDLTNVTQVTVANRSPAVPAFALTLAIYLAISLVVSLGVNLANRRVRLVTR